MRALWMCIVMTASLSTVVLAEDESGRKDSTPPGWYSKLDRDANGVLDASEAGRFLAAMDSDGDDQITVAEAMAYEKRRVEAARLKGERPRRGQMLVKAEEFASRKKTGKGLWVVSIGHSCVIPAIEPCISISRSAEFTNHTHLMQFFGGGGGAARAQWQHEGDRQQAKAALVTGKVDVMTFGHLVAFNGMSVGCDVEDYERWIDFAIEHNPRITFYIQDLWPWLPGPERGIDLDDFALKDYEAAMDVSSRSINSVVEALNRKYPGRIHILPAGLAMTELVRRVTRNDLPGVDALLVGQEQKKKGLKVGLYRDKIHPTELIASLQGYIYYTCLYRKNPTKLKTSHYRGEALDRVIREVAWQVAVDSHYTGVKAD